MVDISVVGINEAVGTVVATAASVITWYVRKTYKNIENRGEKIDEHIHPFHHWEDKEYLKDI